MNKKNRNLAIIASFTSLLSFIATLPVLFTGIAPFLGDTPITYAIAIIVSTCMSMFLSFMIMDNSTSITYKLEGYLIFGAFQMIIIDKTYQVMAGTQVLDLYSFEALNTPTMITAYLSVCFASLTMFSIHFLLDLSSSIGNHLLLSQVLTNKNSILHKGKWLSSIASSWAMEKDKRYTEDQLLAIINYIEHRNFVDKKFVTNHKVWLKVLTMSKPDIESKFLELRQTDNDRNYTVYPEWNNFSIDDNLEEDTKDPELTEINIARSI